MMGVSVEILPSRPGGGISRTKFWAFQAKSRTFPSILINVMKFQHKWTRERGNDVLIMKRDEFLREKPFWKILPYSLGMTEH